MSSSQPPVPPGHPEPDADERVSRMGEDPKDWFPDSRENTITTTDLATNRARGQVGIDLIGAIIGMTDKEERQAAVRQILLDDEPLGQVAAGHVFLWPQTHRALSALGSMPGLSTLARDLRKAVIAYAIKLYGRSGEPEANSNKASDDQGVPPRADPATWERLAMTKAGRPQSSLSNIAFILEHDPRWAGRIRFNEFDQAIYQDEKALADEHITQIAVQIERDYLMQSPGTDRTGKAAYMLAKRNAFHPVREYLSGLEWDGYERIDQMLTLYFGVRDTPLYRQLSRKFLIAAVARIFKPGCQVDTTLVLRGKQGDQKSTGIKALFSAAWYSDTVLKMGHKDAYAQIAGVWGYELSEMAGVSTDADYAKSFLSSSRDRHRPAYGRLMVTTERCCVFIGTTNRHTFLTDPTGSRRFWPAETNGVEVEQLRRDRDQLWAEAVHAFQAGEKWWLERSQELDLKQESEAYRVAHPWEPVVLSWVGGRNDFTIADVLIEALGMDKSRMERKHNHIVADILRAAGYTPKQTTINRKKGRYWRREPVSE